MNKKKLGILLPIILLFTFLVKADVAPDPGMVRVKIDLVIETKEDLSDYRFFLDFYGDLREVGIKSKGRTTIPSMGGGARYSSGKLLAIPKKSLSEFEDKLSTEQLNNLSESIKNKKIEGVIDLASHRFSQDIPAGETLGETYYVVKREEDTLKATKIADDKPKSTTTQQLISSDSRKNFVVSGILITLGVLFIGIWAFRKSKKRSEIKV